MWLCRDYGSSQASRSKLLKHFRLVHGHYGRKHKYPCAYSNCPCTFKTWNALRSHLSTSHGSEQLPQNSSQTTCMMMSCQKLISSLMEFSRITTIPLVSKFMGQLDHFSSQLLKNFKKKGGVAAQKITDILSVLDQHECILKALVVYLNEDPSNIVKYMVSYLQLLFFFKKLFIFFSKTSSYFYL
ncbi:Zinc finger protein 526 [Labeo rohita]|uniref:Zinc finger protein 526 n=1 Tax=Labeo rohita TaxID=84645 RepID=A0ABQ8LFE8_LABRO|nr:Zinc finger protein 526 [Labeo rohita]